LDDALGYTDQERLKLMGAVLAAAARENLMDRMNTTELAANQFRMTQTRDKLAKHRVKDQQGAIYAPRQA